MRQNGFTIWFTGLSGAGKSTISDRLVYKLSERGATRIEVLDGDVVRTNLSEGLGFSREDRDKNILRIGFVCELLSRNGVIAIAAAISPYREIRDKVRSLVGDFVEVYVKASMDTLVRRDVKGLYKKALAGELKNFTGVSDPYEPPLHPEVVLETDSEDSETSVNKLLSALERLGYLSRESLSLEKEDDEKMAGPLRSEARTRTDNRYSRDSKPAADLTPVPPHGGVLVNKFLAESGQNAVLDRIESFKSLTLSEREWSDIELIATGAYSPLTGFVGELDYRSIIENGRLSNGLAWTIPILLLVEGEEAKSLAASNELILRDNDGKKLALLHLTGIYKVDKEELTERVWQTTDRNHPGVKDLFDEGNFALAGDIDVVRLGKCSNFREFRLTPLETRTYFKAKGWKTIAAFQTRNPVHRAHEYLQKVALESVDGLFLHPLVGETKGDDIPAAVRMECYMALLKNYYPADRVLLSVMPAAMRYAGPKEAIHHAIIRQNYGCTHFIVGRDHAGVGNYYGTYDAQKIFDGYDSGELRILPLKFEHTFYCRRCDGMASEKTCPHSQDERIILSGSKVRDRLRDGNELPKEFSRPEVVEILRQHYSHARVSSTHTGWI